MTRQVVFVHLFNDASGSPRVLREAIRTAVRIGYSVHLVVGSGGDGHLSLPGVPTTSYWYRRGRWRPATFFFYFASQVFLFWKLLFSRTIQRDAVIYVNTLLPFGAALFARLTGRRVLYHLHEISIAPSLLRLFLVKIAQSTAYQVIYVSKSHQQALPIAGVPHCIVYNAVSMEFLERAKNFTYTPYRDGQFRILMLASLRAYKGVPEFIELARRLKSDGRFAFELLLNESKSSLRRFASSVVLPPNLEVHPRSDDPTVYYARASVVMNLSRPDMWIETFGLTILEAMTYGVPIVAPPIGGPTELITDGVEGYLIDSRSMDDVIAALARLANDTALCQRMSHACKRRSAQYSGSSFETGVSEAIDRCFT
jgi:glycosyltransferase involved in cell wall biosynthesis